MGFNVRRDTVKLGNLLSIAEQIQAFGLGRKTGEIYITNVPPPARINLLDGEIVDAQYGLQSGLPAAISLINLRDPQSEFIVGEKPQRKTIDMPYVQILCEAARFKDEAPLPGKMVAGSKNSPSNPSLRISMKTETKTYPIRPGLAYIGRSSLNEIVILDATISQRHAFIEYSRNGVFLKDLSSTNGTYVGGQQIEERWLGPEEVIQFGGVQCLFTGGVKK